MKEYIYILKLQNEKIYTGKSSDPDARYLQHKYGNGAEWTKQYKPIELLDVIPVTSEHDETNITKDLMKKYGIDNVRGGPWTSVVLNQQEKSFIQKQIHSESDECYGCGESDHFVKECPKRSNTYECYGCQETGHFVRDCPNKVEEIVSEKKNQNQEDLLITNLKSLKTKKMNLKKDVKDLKMKKMNLKKNVKDLQKTKMDLKKDLMMILLTEKNLKNNRKMMMMNMIK
jgi:predicted GIY-YIG superfamily endonuclease